MTTVPDRETSWLSRHGGRAQVRVPACLARWLARRGKVADTYVHEHRPDGTVVTTKTEGEAT